VSKDARKRLGLCFEQSYSGTGISEERLEVSGSKYKSGCLRGEADSLKHWACFVSIQKLK